MTEKAKTIIGRNVSLTFIGHAQNVPAKVDTGADSSTVWASNIFIDEKHLLHFTLFAEGSPFYTGEEIVTDEYKVALVRSSSGHEQMRYRAYFPISIAGRRVKALFSLSNRKRHKFPILVGRRLLQGKFLVDVAMAEYESKPEDQKQKFNQELKKDPYKFYQKYHGSQK